MATSPSPPSRWPPQPMTRMGLLALLVGLLAASAPMRAVDAAGVLRQVVGRGDGGTFFEPFNVTYDHRAVILGGKRRMLVSAGLHYPRATPEMWPSLIAKVKEGGADVIETYIFWNGHEPAKGQYYFEGRFDIVKFAKLVAAEGLFLFLRIGPYACAEWNFGGFPVWLRDIPGIEFRTDNEPYKIENEYGNIQGQYGQAGKRYMLWAAQMALALDTGIPWITSYDYDAPIDEYGILRQPKWGHLKDLHAAIKLCEPALIAVDGSPQYVKLGPMQEVCTNFGSKVGHWVSLNQPVELVQGLNKLTLLSEIVGLQNYGAFLEKDGAGFRGQVKLTGFPNGDIDLTKSLWTYQIGLKGEFSKIYSPENQGCAKWSSMQNDDTQTPFTWFKTMFDAPEGNDPVAIGLGSMGKGQAWVNGHLIGRYWSLVAPESGYHIPREWLQESDNLLVLFEETGGDPSQISLEVHYTKTICSKVSETYYPPLSSWSRAANGRASVNTVAPELHLQCDEGHVISKVTFASYGTPSGDCQNFSVGNCHASTTLDLVTEACVGENKCSISVTNNVFGDPCRKVVKDLAVEAECSPPLSTKEARDDM
nr:unnamed protein product [Digitaria exilis]